MFDGPDSPTKFTSREWDALIAELNAIAGSHPTTTHAKAAQGLCKHLRQMCDRYNDVVDVAMEGRRICEHAVKIFKEARKLPSGTHLGNNLLALSKCWTF